MDFKKPCYSFEENLKIVMGNSITEGCCAKKNERFEVKLNLGQLPEVKLKEFISHLIDKWDIPAKNLFSERSIEIKLEVLDHLDKSSSKLTKGKIIAAHLENLNPWVVQDIMNRINKLDFL